MHPSLPRTLAVVALFLPALACAAKTRPCLSPDAAAQLLNKDICISAHVYDVVSLPDGTRFLDICSPQTSDDQCRFTIVSLREDHDTVGELDSFRHQNVQIRGIVQHMHGRSVIVLSHVRQFHGGPPRFQPNPLLAHGFSAEQDRPPIADPNLRPQGGHRSFMNTKARTTLPAK